MRQLESSCFIDDDPTLIDFLKRRSAEKTRMPIYNINEQPLPKSHVHSTSLHSPDRVSRHSMFTARKPSAEDRGFRVRTSSTLRVTQTAQPRPRVDLLQLKRQMLEVTERHPALARIAKDRLRELSTAQVGARTRNPAKGSLKKSLLTLQPRRHEEPKPNDRLKTKLLALMVDNPFKPVQGFSEFV